MAGKEVVRTTQAAVWQVKKWSEQHTGVSVVGKEVVRTTQVSVWQVKKWSEQHTGVSVAGKEVGQSTYGQVADEAVVTTDR